MFDTQHYILKTLLVSTLRSEQNQIALLITTLTVINLGHYLFDCTYNFATGVNKSKALYGEVADSRLRSADYRIIDLKHYCIECRITNCAVCQHGANCRVGTAEYNHTTLRVAASADFFFK